MKPFLWSVYLQNTIQRQQNCTNSSHVCHLPIYDSLLSDRLSSPRLAFMKRPSTSCSTSLKMDAGRTMHSWRPQGALQVDLTTSTRTKRGSASKECDGFTSSALMTALTTISDPTVYPLFSALKTTSASVHPCICTRIHLLHIEGDTQRMTGI